MENDKKCVSVLVVEDEEGLRDSIKRDLSEMANVRVARDGREALLMMEEELPTVLVTDIVMPGLDGAQLLREIRSRRWWLPVLMITGYDSDDNRAIARSFLVFEFLPKPFFLKEVRRAVEKGIVIASRIQDIDTEVAKYFSDTQTPADMEEGLRESVRQMILEKLLKGEMENVEKEDAAVIEIEENS